MLLSSIQTEDVFRVVGFEIYSCIGYGLSFPDKRDLSVIHSIIAHSMDIFSTGMMVLAHSFHHSYMLWIVLLIMNLKSYQKLSQHLRRSIVVFWDQYLSRILQNLGSAALVNTLLAKNLDRDHVDTSANDSKNVTITKNRCSLRLFTLLQLGKKILTMEKTACNISNCTHNDCSISWSLPFVRGRHTGA